MTHEPAPLSDMLTGLPNRSSCNERLGREIARARQLGWRLALIGVDLNRFKEINDLLGRPMPLAEIVRGGQIALNATADEAAADSATL